jgi:predicted CoA-binding protein
MADMDTIVRFLRCRRLALVGVSRDPRDFSRALMRDLMCRGYDVVPVNPATPMIEGLRCYGTVAEVAGPVEGALLMTPPAQGAAAVRDCLRAGVPRIWFHRGIGPGASSPEALRLCREAGVEVVDGECPYMFLPGASLFHRIHRFFRHGRGEAA